MSNDTANIFAAALTLPEGDRADLAFQLLGTLRAPAVPYEDDTQLAAELERRCVSFEAGETSAASIDEVTERVQNALRNRKNS